MIAYTCHGVSCIGKGIFDEAEKCLLKGIGFCEKLNEKAMNIIAHVYLGEIYFEKGDFPKSEEWYGKGSRLIKDSRLSSSLAGLTNVGSIRARNMIEPKDIDLESLYAYSRNL